MSFYAFRENFRIYSSACPASYYVSYFVKEVHVRALRGSFGPLWSQKLKIAFHQFPLTGVLEE